MADAVGVGLRHRTRAYCPAGVATRAGMLSPADVEGDDNGNPRMTRSRSADRRTRCWSATRCSRATKASCVHRARRDSVVRACGAAVAATTIDRLPALVDELVILVRAAARNCNIICAAAALA